MNELSALTGFFAAINNDCRISITHIGLFASLLQYWTAHNYQEPLRVYSHEIKAIAKINANATYYRCMKDLSNYGYIRYLPSYKRNDPSKVYFIKFQSELSDDEYGGDYKRGFKAV